MKRNLIEDLHYYFEQKDERTHDEEMLYMELQGRLPYFPVTHVSRDDLEGRGFDTSDTDDCTMERIASKMGDAYQENGYWIDLDILAEDVVPKYKCPKCWKGAGRYFDGKCHCGSCNHDWDITEPTGRYVLVESPEDSSFFDKNDIGFDCYNSDDNGARYVPEHIYIAHFDREPKEKQIYLPIGWPESQIYLDWEHTDSGKFIQCEYINPADTMLELGNNALFVPKSLIKTK
ncbi:MAG: hypothetical protein SNJ29_15265 [Rikenellaceae bacterium]